MDTTAEGVGYSEVGGIVGLQASQAGGKGVDDLAVGIGGIRSPRET